MSSGRTPPGWPRNLPPEGSAEFGEKVVPWLLDHGPAELRTSPLRTLPPALARYLSHYVEGCLVATRRAYGQARVELGGIMPPDQVATAQNAIEAEGARMLQAQREIALVEAAVFRRWGAPDHL